MGYIDMINDSLDYIEENITKAITIDELSGRYYISRYYFYRIFRALLNMTIKEYIDERRLTEAAKKIKDSSRNIIDIAFDFGYESHEVFTRGFKRYFSLTPLEYRKSGAAIPLFERPEIVEREFKNLNKDIVVDFRVLHMGTSMIRGTHNRVNPYIQEEISSLKSYVEGFVEDYVQGKGIDRLFNITNGETGDDTIDCFVGYEKTGSDSNTHLEELLLKESDYAVFRYRGDMKDIHVTAFDDICKAILVADLHLNKNGIDCMEVYDKECVENNQFFIYVPVLK